MHWELEVSSVFYLYCDVKAPGIIYGGRSACAIFCPNWRNTNVEACVWYSGINCLRKSLGCSSSREKLLKILKWRAGRCKFCAVSAWLTNGGYIRPNLDVAHNAKHCRILYLPDCCIFKSLFKGLSVKIVG